MPARARITIAQCEEALRACAGKLAPAAARLGIDRSTLARRVAASPRLQRVIAELEETHTDHAELAHLGQIAAKDGAAVRFELARKGKRRGWGAGADGSAKSQDATPVVSIPKRKFNHEEIKAVRAVLALLDQREAPED